jgi:hypothetical protein
MHWRGVVAFGFLRLLLGFCMCYIRLGLGIIKMVVVGLYECRFITIYDVLLEVLIGVRSHRVPHSCTRNQRPFIM